MRAAFKSLFSAISHTPRENRARENQRTAQPENTDEVTQVTKEIYVKRDKPLTRTKNQATPNRASADHLVRSNSDSSHSEETQPSLAKVSKPANSRPRQIKRPKGSGNRSDEKSTAYAHSAPTTPRKWETDSMSSNNGPASSPSTPRGTHQNVGFSLRTDTEEISNDSDNKPEIKVEKILSSSGSSSHDSGSVTASRSHTRPNLRNFARRAEKKISRLKLPTLFSNSKLESPSTSPRKSVRKDALMEIPGKDRFKFAEEVSQLRAKEEDKKNSEATEKFTIPGKIIGFLSDRGIPFDSALIAALSKDSANYKKQTVDLTDPLYSTHIKAAAKASFEDNWGSIEEEGSENTSKQEGSEKSSKADSPRKTAKVVAVNKYKSYVEKDLLQPIFLRDFDHSDYYFLQSDGSKKKITSLDEFIQLTTSDEISDMPKIVSNIATQSLGLFLTHAVFRRQTEGPNKNTYNSALKFSDGTDVTPNGGAGLDIKTEYVISRSEEGDVILDYKRNSYSNKTMPLSAKAVNGTQDLYQLRDDACIEISIRVTISPDGNWAIDDPEIVTYHYEPAV